MSKFVKWLIAICVVVALAVLAAGSAIAYLYWYVNDRPIAFNDDKIETEVDVKKGSSVQSIINQLVAAGVNVRPDIASAAFRYFEADKNIHVGRYLVEPNQTLKELIEHFKSGNVIMSRFTLVEGTETKKFLDKIFKDEDLDQPSPTPTPEEVMKLVGAPEGTNPEGQFAADTYVFAAGSPVSAVLKQAYNQQQKRIKKAWDTRDPDVAVKSPYELLILASMIEKETGHPDDRRLVSCVFNNRLKKKMPLQSDPTVIYNVDNYDGKILKSHLTAKHPYNTYLNLGLPPTPIANPGPESIDAAAHPEKKDYLYFVAMGGGKSYFTSNLRDHNQAVNKYLRSQGK